MVYQRTYLESHVRSQALSVGLEQSHDFLLSKHAHILSHGNESTLRLVYYPSIGAPEQGLTRCGAHCDYGTFTLLAQVFRSRALRLRVTFWYGLGFAVEKIVRS